MNILFYFGHPAQYLFAKESIKKLKERHQVVLVLKTKDVLEDLLKSDEHDYINILPDERGKSKLSIVFSLVKRIFKIFPLIVKYKANILISTDASVALVGKLLNKHVITITEDDYHIIKSLGDLTYPVTSSIFCPAPCDVGRWTHKKIGYFGYMKLAYLHPKVFTPDPNMVYKYGLVKDYVLIRVAKLTAHHDFGIKGLDVDLIKNIISILKSFNLTPYISSEAPLTEELKEYELKIKVSDMHHILSFAQLIVCDSQSMCVEASMLGIPSLRYSSFAGKISVLEELEHKYQLTFGVLPGNNNLLISKLLEILQLPDFRITFSERRKNMLKEKINVSEFFTWFVENYPSSKTIFENDPSFQFRFK